MKRNRAAERVWQTIGCVLTGLMAIESRRAAQAAAVRAEPPLGPDRIFEETPTRVFVRKSLPELVE
jgi:hypothetical protein